MAFPGHTRGLRSVAVAVAFAFVVTLAGAPPAGAVSAPSVRLIATTDEVRVREQSRGGLGVDLGVWLASVGGDFQIRLSRADYASDVTATQTTSTGSVVRAIPAGDLDGWFGLARFMHLSVKNANGRAVFRSVQTFCPNGWDLDRVDDSGPMNPTYPQWCGANPFTLGVVWGIDEGWATNPLAWTWLPARLLPAGTYSVRVWIDPAYTDLFEVPATDAEVRITLDVTSSGSTAEAVPSTSLRRPRAGAPSTGAPRPYTTVPEIVPSGDAEPDLAALPAWGISVTHRKGRDYLVFGATVWNGGPSPMIVEGYRASDSDVMDAWQYFTDPSGSVIGKAQVGQLQYDSRPGHRHWHFEQFASYSLTGATRTEAVRSDKASFCLAPTDPVDLLAPGAEWNPYQTGLYSACGEPSSLWVRETLPVGWGDTYFQWLPGQSFDVTDLPNGKYFIRVQVNPLGALYDRTADDDVSYRRIRLRGRPGDRWVVVPPYENVDSEGCFSCFVAPGQPPWDGVPSWPPA
jgi:hypothetical protein